MLDTRRKNKKESVLVARKERKIDSPFKGLPRSDAPDWIISAEWQGTILQVAKVL